MAIDNLESLTVDIWVPTTASPSSQLPVKAWVFGGVGVAGGISDPLYDGCNLASDSIVVSINYRVGPLGFLSLSSAGIQGNMAVQDVILGLELIQTNIASFGGDPVSTSHKKKMEGGLTERPEKSLGFRSSRWCRAGIHFKYSSQCLVTHALYCLRVWWRTKLRPIESD